MKKVLLVIIVVLILFASCNASLRLLNEDGFKLFQCGWSIGDNQCIAQTHEGFVVNDFSYQEGVFDLPVTIENPVRHEIQVKITSKDFDGWVGIPALGELTITSNP